MMSSSKNQRMLFNLDIDIDICTMLPIHMFSSGVSCKWRRMGSDDADCLSQLNHPIRSNKTESVVVKIFIVLHRCLWNSDSDFDFRANLANSAWLLHRFTLDRTENDLMMASSKNQRMLFNFDIDIDICTMLTYRCFHRECLVNGKGWRVMMQGACPSLIIQQEAINQNLL